MQCVIWALIFFRPLLALVGCIIEAFGLPNPSSDGFNVVYPQSDNDFIINISQDLEKSFVNK